MKRTAPATRIDDAAVRSALFGDHVHNTSKMSARELLLKENSSWDR